MCRNIYDSNDENVTNVELTFAHIINTGFDLSKRIDNKYELKYRIKVNIQKYAQNIKGIPVRYNQWV